MNEKPILFTGDMIRAILDGSKTQTRRVVKPQPDVSFILDGDRFYKEMGFPNGRTLVKSPYGEPGDKLWVRETWAAETVYDDMKPSEIPEDSVIWYKATDEDMTKNSMTVGKWRPSIYMCRWMSRIDLLVKRVWVERVQDASIENIIAEGCPAEHYPENCGGFPHAVSGWFEHLWDSINADRGFGWDENPWVFVVEYEEEKCQQ